MAEKKTKNIKSANSLLAPEGSGANRRKKARIKSRFRKFKTKTTGTSPATGRNRAPRKKQVTSIAARPTSLSPQKRIVKQSLKSSAIVNAKLVPNHPDVKKTVVMFDRLISNRIIPPSRLTNINAMATAALAGMNMTIRDDVGQDYTLLKSCNDQNLLDNLQIIDPNLKVLENTLTDPNEDKFVNKDDPFFELDEGRPKYQKKQQQVLKHHNRKNVVKIASDMFSQNTRKGAGSSNLMQLTK